MSEIVMIPVEKIRPSPFQPRETFKREKIMELAASIKATGLIQPILVRKDGETYQIIAGERRWRAFQFTELKKIPCMIMNVDDLQARELSLVENWHRVNLEARESETFISSLYENGKARARARSEASTSSASDKSTSPPLDWRAKINRLSARDFVSYL